MPNLSNKKVLMPEQNPDIRNTNFYEVTLGYTKKMAIEEAQRCLNCKHKPCVNGCPVSVDIPEFIALVIEGEFEKAYNVIIKNNALPAICGRVCPQENQCEGKCVRNIKGESVAIGRLERFVADWHIKNINAKKTILNNNSNKVAVIGAGPAGLACAGSLIKKGFNVTIFEAFHDAGGVLLYGIPEFRLPKVLVKKEIEALKLMGVEIKLNTVIGKTMSLDDLQDMGYEAFFIGSGAGIPKFMGIEGESLLGVYSANEFLTRINLMKAYLDEYDTPIKKVKSIAVVGGGNVAMDAARSAKRLGCEKVYIIYRRSLDEIPARKEEVHHAQQEGIEFLLLSNPVKINGDENGIVKNIECVKMSLRSPDESGRMKPIKIDNSNFLVEVDNVIISVGTQPNPIISSSIKEIEINKSGCIIVDDNMQTTKDGVFAGGDAVTGAATVILAMGAGKKAAGSIEKYFKRKT